MDRRAAPGHDPPGRRQLTAWRGAVLLVPLLLAGAGCGGDAAPEPTRVAGIPVLEESTAGPGTELGAGFTVVEGSVLLGAPFPLGTEVVYDGVPLEDRGFRAVLLVTGELGRVFDAYRRQAQDAGLRLGPNAARVFCSDDTVHHVAFCSGAVYGSGPSRSMSLEAWRSPARGDRAPLSHLYLEYRDSGGPTGSPPAERLPAQLGDGGAPLPEGWPHLPDEGEPLEVQVGQEPLLVPRGTQLVAHAGLSGRCGPGGGAMALLRTDDDPESVIERILEQHPEAEPGPPDHWTEAGAELRSQHWNWGGGSYGVWSMSRPEEPTWVLVDHCGVD